jgi:DNA-binding transcriptional regulator LsrR (DeoR family)
MKKAALPPLPFSDPLLPRQPRISEQLTLMALAGEQNRTIAGRLGISRPTINLWRKRARKSGIGEVWEIAPSPDCRSKRAAVAR